MTDDYDLDWLTEHRPQVDAPTPAATHQARSSLLAHGGRRQRQRRIAGGVATGVLAVAVIVAVVLLGSGIVRSPRTPHRATLAVTAPPSTTRPATGPAPLLRLAADVRRLRHQPGDATLVVRHDVTHEQNIGTFTAYDLYADDGRYYFGDSTTSLRAALQQNITQTNMTSPRVLRSFVHAAVDSPARARATVVATQPRAAVTPQPHRAAPPTVRRLAAHNRARYERAHHGHPPPRWTFRAYLDSYLWIVATQALQTGAGRPQVRAGAMQVLASLQHVTQTLTRLDGRPVLRVRFANLGIPETVWLADGTGVPLREVDGSGPDAAVTTYHVRRVTLAHLR